jgi:hypothetical protein
LTSLYSNIKKAVGVSLSIYPKDITDEWSYDIIVSPDGRSLIHLTPVDFFSMISLGKLREQVVFCNRDKSKKFLESVFKRHEAEMIKLKKEEKEQRAKFRRIKGCLEKVKTK